MPPEARRVRRVSDILHENYGSPRLGNPLDPLDDLVYIILSNKTTPKAAAASYKIVKERFPKWDDLLASKPDVLRRLIKPNGLSIVKSRQIRAALSKIAADFGSCSLDQLRGKSEYDSEKYLCLLPGVSTKVAKCVLMYTLRGRVLPVDAHVYRVSKRLGWTTKNRADQSHDELEALVPPDRRYAYHVDCIILGRNVCRPKDPLCDTCPVKLYCNYYKDIYSLNHGYPKIA